MASDDIKEAIVSYFDDTGIETVEKDWKRIAKRKLTELHTLREFHNARLSRTVYTIGDDEDASVIEKDVWIYGYAPVGNTAADRAFVAFEPQDRWRRECRMHDQHQSDVVKRLFGLEGLDEVGENEFVPTGDMSEADLRTKIEARGFVHDPEYSSYIAGGPDAHKPVKQAATAPIDPPTPPLLVDTPKTAAKAKVASRDKVKLLPVTDHANVAIEVAAADMCVWEAEYRHHAHHKVQREMRVNRIEQISPGVYAETTRENVDTDQPLYPNATHFRAKVLENYGIDGRIARNCVNQDKAIEVDGGLERRMSFSGFYHVVLMTREVAGKIVELRAYDGHIYSTDKNQIETLLFTMGADEIKALGAATTDPTKSWAETWPIIADEDEDVDPAEYSGRIVFCDIEGEGKGAYFMCAYETADGGIADDMNVPEAAFEDLFPEYKADWNTSEASHYIFRLEGQTIAQLEKVVRERLLSVGCVEMV